MIPEGVVAEVKSRADLLLVVGRYVQLKRAGRNHVGLCPFHGEKTPSFNVRPDLGFFKCFGCGVGGDVFSFLERVTGRDFPTVVRELAGDFGVKWEAEAVDEREAKRRAEIAATAKVVEVAQRYFASVLRHPRLGAPARAYLAQRSIPAAVATKYGLGFFADPAALQRALRAAGVTAGAVERSGLLFRDRGAASSQLVGRLTFPICDGRGRVAGFSARQIGDGAGPKYRNSKASLLFDKARLFFGIAEALPAWKRGAGATVVEGQLDVLALAQAGVEGAVAPCGAALTESHAELLARHCGKVSLVFDADSAGRAGLERATRVLLARGIEARVGTLPANEDPASILASKGAEAVARVSASATSVLDLWLADAEAHANEGAQGRVDALRELLTKASQLAVDSLEERELLARASQLFAQDAEWLRAKLSVLRSKALSKTRHAKDRSTKSEWTPQERVLVRAVLSYPELVPLCAVMLERMRNRELAVYLAAAHEAIVRFVDLEPRDAMLRVPAPRPVVEAFADLTRNPDHGFALEDARQLVDRMVAQLDVAPARRALELARQRIQAASDAGDLETARRILQTEHLEAVSRLRAAAS